MNENPDTRTKPESPKKGTMGTVPPEMWTNGGVPRAGVAARHDCNTHVGDDRKRNRRAIHPGVSGVNSLVVGYTEPRGGRR